MACRQQHGKIKSAHQRWTVYPPAHPNCHCIIDKLLAIEAGGATNRGADGADWHLLTTGELPDYYIDKYQAQNAGWRRQDCNLSSVLPGMMIGGDVFYNNEGKLPEAPNRIWRKALGKYITLYM
jgi:hypothetical protein